MGTKPTKTLPTIPEEITISRKNPIRKRAQKEEGLQPTSIAIKSLPREQELTFEEKLAESRRGISPKTIY